MNALIGVAYVNRVDLRRKLHIHSDPHLQQYVNDITFPMYERYYEAKWGGRPGEERFITPFQDK